MRRVDARQFARALAVLAAHHEPKSLAAAGRAYLAQRNASSLLPRIRAALRQEVAQTRVQLETAPPLSASTQTQLAKLIEHRWPRHDVQFTVNPALLGGFRLRQGDLVIDYSLATILGDLDRTLTEVHHG